MSLVPVGSPDRIVTWGPVDIGSGDIINVNSTPYELKTEVSPHTPSLPPYTITSSHQLYCYSHQLCICIVEYYRCVLNVVIK